MLLQIDSLSLSFLDPHRAGVETPVLHDICLTLDRGETHALVGESGSGKSVTALSILRLLEHSSRVRSTGRILFEDEDILGLDEKQMRSLRGNRISMIFQEPMTALNPVYPVGSQLMEPLLLHRGMSRTEARREAAALLDRTGISQPEERLDSYPHQLSGGQRQRVLIAMALACRPSLLIADEPTTALDVTIQAQILELIRSLQQEYRMALLLITHDLPMVRHLADTLSIMHQGRVVEQGPAAAVLAAPKQQYTRHLLAAQPGTPLPPRPPGDPLLTGTGIACRFKLGGSGFWPWSRPQAEVRALDEVDFQVQQGRTLGVVGESGSGKSTLGLCLLRLQGCQGSLHYYDRENKTTALSSLRPREMRPLRRELQVVFQDPFSSLSPRMSVEQIIAEGLEVHGIGATRAERRALVEEALAEVELDTELADRYPHELSGGQRQRIAIARAIVLKPRLVILDEPTSALDATIQAQVLALLRSLQERYTLSYIFISHDLRVVRSMADDLLVLHQGRVVEHGPAAAIFAQPAQDYTRRLLAAALG
ncbi:MAG: microcin ABC transporter ATP-binding protein [Desulfobulbaceae bacterium A2]|nr:MAG: microcin ABC transporter ATP-binding protein [Desulfobulbaceae bacterium A2]